MPKYLQSRIDAWNEAGFGRRLFASDFLTRQNWQATSAWIASVGSELGRDGFAEEPHGFRAADLLGSDDFVFVARPSRDDDRPQSVLERHEMASSAHAGDGARDAGADPFVLNSAAEEIAPQSVIVADDEGGFSAAGAAAAKGRTIAHAGKIGIGTWDIDGSGTAARHVKQMNFGWYYTWGVNPLHSNGKAADDSLFVPMFWGKDSVTRENRQLVKHSEADYLLGFNEPDLAAQSNLTVKKALALWPKLMATDKLLGSPATTTGQTLGEDSWLGRFMAKAEKRDYDVDFIAVHYYTSNDSIGAFKSFLRQVHREYDRPVWVTEWALVDWSDPDRFSRDKLADFAHDAIQMMDDLKFVKRHAWFAAYSGGDGWHINTEVFDNNGNLTPIGQTFADLTL